MKKNFVILAAVVIALIFSFSITPFVYKHLDSDFKRHGVLIKTLEDTAHFNARILLFGHSVMMSGINATIISDSLKVPVYHFGSSSQSLAEAMLYYTKIPSSVKAVYQFILPSQLYMKPASLNAMTVRNMRMLGYKFNLQTDTLLPETELRYFNENKIKLFYESRLIVLNSINTSFRNLLRRDLETNSKTGDLHNPSVYTKRLPSDKYLMDVTHSNMHPIYQLNQITMNHLNKANTYFISRGIEYSIVLLPVNPDLTFIDEEYKKSVIDSLSKFPELTFINCMSVLSAEHYVDHKHILPTGQFILSSEFAHLIKDHAF